MYDPKINRTMMISFIEDREMIVPMIKEKINNILAEDKEKYYRVMYLEFDKTERLHVEYSFYNTKPYMEDNYLFCLYPGKWNETYNSVDELIDIELEERLEWLSRHEFDNPFLNNNKINI